MFIMGKKKKVERLMTINVNELLIHSANKLGRHDDIVKTGCGVHKTNKTYTRREKHNKDYKSYTDLCLQY